jgi:hypothetical protein
LLPALWVVWGYTALGREVQSPALGKSAQCLFGATVLVQLYELGTLGVFALAGQVVVWSLFCVGLVVLMMMPFVSGTADKKPEPAKPAEESTTPSPTDKATSNTAKAGVFGAAAIGLAAAGKVLGKVLMKVAIFKGAVNLFKGLVSVWDAVAAVVAYGLAGVFLTWFGIVKIRLRRRLGGLSALLGWIEILRFVALVAMNVAIGVQLAHAADQPGIKRAEFEDLKHRLVNDYLAVGLVADLVWTAVTVWFFLSLSGRRDPDAEYRDDLARAASEAD